MTAGVSRQRGQALMLMLLILALGATWYLVRNLDSVAGDYTAANREQNARVLNRAKQALIGYVAAQASFYGENNPGALPCPEAPASFNSTSGTDGKVASSCTPPEVGRFPWRTLGMDKLVDASGEPLWYVVSAGWAYNGSNTVINSNSVGQLVVDGSAGTDGDTVVALIIAPGPPITVTASANCSAIVQTRLETAPPDWRNWLECENATYPTPDATFASTGPSGSFNDQVVKITKADIMPGIEAAIAKRIEVEIAPLLKAAVYSGASWGLGTNYVYPFAAPFGDPSASSMQGSLATLASGGLLPLNYAETSPGSGVACTSGPSAPRCSPSFVTWTSASLSGASLYSPTCTFTATQIDCSFYYRCLLLGCAGSTVDFTLTANASNVGMALRQLNTAVPMTNVDSANRTASGNLKSDGSADITFTGKASVNGSGSWLVDALCGLIWPLTLILGCQDSTISVPVLLLADNAVFNLLNSGNNSWFLRNKWHEVTYYAVAAPYTPAAPSTCSDTAPVTCLTVSNLDTADPTKATKSRAILILTGRSINNSTRPSGTLANYLEFGNATASFERQPVSTMNDASLKSPYNDRFVVVDTN